MDKRLKLETILNFVDNNTRSRCLTEAEKILASNHLIRCGLKSKQSNEVFVEAVCLRSSSIKETPHEIKGNFLENKDGWDIKSIECSCKAGKSQRCKHCVAVLLYCNRNNIEDLEQLSSTDLKCSWNKIKANYPAYAHPIPVIDYCHTKPVTLHVFSENKQKKFRAEMMNIAHNSVYAKHKTRYSNRTESEPVPDPIINRREKVDSEVIMNILSSPLSPQLKFDLNSFVLDPDVKCFYFNNIQVTYQESVEIATKTVSQNCDLWMQERKKRITGSFAYEFYTYTKNRNPDWKKKIEKVLKPSVFSNVAMEHGQSSEGDARQSYAEVFGEKIFQSGLLIHPAVPFLGYSPDGMISGADGLKLLEIKSPIVGVMKSAVELVPNLDYLVINNTGEYSLKKKHKYYGQVQLGMYITGANSCDFIIFSSHDNSIVRVNVNKDMAFLDNMISALSHVYFNFMLPAIM